MQPLLINQDRIRSQSNDQLFSNPHLTSFSIFSPTSQSPNCFRKPQSRILCLSHLLFRDLELVRFPIFLSQQIRVLVSAFPTLSTWIACYKPIFSILGEDFNFLSRYLENFPIFGRGVGFFPRSKREERLRLRELRWRPLRVGKMLLLLILHSCQGITVSRSQSFFRGHPNLIFNEISNWRRYMHLYLCILVT